MDANCPFAIENKYRSKGNGIPAGAWDQAVRIAHKTGQWPSVIYQNGRLAPRCNVELGAIGSAQGGLTLLTEGTADLYMENYAALALRLIGRSIR